MKNMRSVLWLAFLLVTPSLLQGTPTSVSVSFDIPGAYTDSQAPLLADITVLGDIITFIDLPGEGTIKVFSHGGGEVFAMPVLRGQQAQTWSLQNNIGEKLSDGVYVYRIEGGGKTIVGEIVIASPLQ